MNNNLIHGKNPLQNVVGIEDNKDGTTELFIQTPAGDVISKSVLNEYWILTNGQGDEFSQELSGEGHYNYKNTFTLRDEFEYAKKHFRKYGDKAYFINDPKEAFMVANGYTYYKGLKHSEVSVLSFDIETTTLEHTKDAKVLIISNTFRDSNGNKERKLFCYDEYKTDKEFFEAWCSWVREKDPSIIVGHNIFMFDLPYLDFCASRVNCELTLGRKAKPIRFNRYDSKIRKDGSQFYEYKKCHIFGREVVDTFFLSLKYDIGRKYESYGLKSIIQQEGLEVQGRQFYDASLIRKNYKIPDEWTKIKAYALHDADDSLALWDLQGPSYFYMSNSVPKSFQEIVCGAAGSQLNSIMVRAYLQDGHSLPKASEAKQFTGAISIGNPGIFKNVIKFDVASLYPSIMIEYQVYDKVKDPKGYFKELIETFTNLRLEHKKLAKKDKYYDDLQSSEKIFINSCYGFLGAPGLLFNSSTNAAFITEKGREILNQALTWAKDKGFQVVNADTDSISVSQGNSEDISEDQQLVLLKDLQQGFPDRIQWEHDGYYKTIIVLAAKNYILYDGIKIKTKGSSLRDQKKEPALREFLDESIRLLVNDEPTEKLVETYHKYIKESLAVKDIKRWCSKRTITDKVETSERTNETKLKDAIAGTEYVQSDKVYVFFTDNEQLCLAENFNGDYNKNRLLEKVFKTTHVFKNILPVKDLFKNYSLKRNKKLLEELN